MRVSVVAPTFNEAEHIVRTLCRVRESGECELIVVDGGSSDGTLDLVRPHVDIVLSVTQGRARQMNTGAQHASGEILLFLHADTILPQNFFHVLQQAFHDPQVVGGRFDIHLDAQGWPFRMIETLMNYRSRWTRIATGDQAIFVRREIFMAIGGFPELELMEDIAFSRRLKREGKIACVRERVMTSARRWQRNGVLRTIVLMWTLRLAYFLGVPPRQLKMFYADTR